MGSCSSKPKTSEFDGSMDQILESNKPADEPLCKELHFQKKPPPQALYSNSDKDSKVIPSPIEVENGVSCDIPNTVAQPAQIPISEFVSRERLCECLPNNDDLVSQKETVVVEAIVTEAPEFVKERIISSQEAVCKEQSAERNMQKPEADSFEVAGAKRASNEDMEVEKSLHVACENELRKGREANLLVCSEKAVTNACETLEKKEDAPGSRRRCCISEDEEGYEDKSEACCLSAYKCTRGSLQNVSREEDVVSFLKSTVAYSHGSFRDSQRHDLCNEFKQKRHGISRLEPNIQQELEWSSIKITEEGKAKEMSKVKKTAEAKMMEALAIDEVLEKLASEFERQESLSLSSRS